MEEYYLYTFESTHAAIATDKLLKPAGAVVMPVPRFISSSCGISVRITPEKHEEAEKIFAENSKLRPYVNDEDDFDYKYYHVIINKAAANVSCELVK